MKSCKQKVNDKRETSNIMKKERKQNIGKYNFLSSAAAAKLLQSCPTLATP